MNIIVGTCEPKQYTCMLQLASCAQFVWIIHEPLEGLGTR